MGHGVRRGLGRVIPWLALLMVSVFAFAQLRAHRATRAKLRGARYDLMQNIRRHRARTVAEVPAVAEAAPAATASARALDDALSREREGHAKTRAAVAKLEEALAAQRERGDRLAALGAVAGERAYAFEARIAEWREQLRKLELENETLLAHERRVTGEFVESLTALKREVQVLRASAADLATSSPVQRWLEDAASGDDARVKYAQACAKGATPEQIAALGKLLAAEPTHAEAIVRLAGALPASDPATALMVDLVRACSDEAQVVRRLDAVGERHLLNIHALKRLAQTDASVAYRRFVPWAARRWQKLDGDQRAVFAGLLHERLDSGDPATATTAVRAVALAGLPEFGPKIVPLLQTDAAGLRAAAAHALSRIPDLEASKDSVRPHLLPLLADADREVRVAGVLLAEKLLGERLPFDPGAALKARAKALEGLKARLGR